MLNCHTVLSKLEQTSSTNLCIEAWQTYIPVHTPQELQLTSLSYQQKFKHSIEYQKNPTCQEKFDVFHS